MFYLRTQLVTHYHISLYNLLTLIVKTFLAISEEQRPQKPADKALPGLHWRNKFVLWPTLKNILNMSYVTLLVVQNWTSKLTSLKRVINEASVFENFLNESQWDRTQTNEPRRHTCAKKNLAKNGFETIGLFLSDLLFLS